MLVVAGWAVAPSVLAQDWEDWEYTSEFNFQDCQLGPRGVNSFFLPLKPGNWLFLQGEEDDGGGGTVIITLFIKIMPGVKTIGGVQCAIMVEAEWEDENIVEVSYNYVAICSKHGEIYYFGEDVDDYEDGEVVGHDGAWLVDYVNNWPGLLMPGGTPLRGSRYYQEIAPGIALDRAEHTDTAATIDTNAGEFERCLHVVETTPLEPGEESEKAYARGIGLILDDDLTLVSYNIK